MKRYFGLVTLSALLILLGGCRFKSQPSTVPDSPSQVNSESGTPDNMNNEETSEETNSSPEAPPGTEGSEADSRNENSNVQSAEEVSEIAELMANITCISYEFQLDLTAMADDPEAQAARTTRFQAELMEILSAAGYDSELAARQDFADMENTNEFRAQVIHHVQQECPEYEFAQ